MDEVVAKQNFVQKISLNTVLFMIFVAFFSPNLIVGVQASSNGDLSITGSSPAADDLIPAYTSSTFSVDIENLDSLQSTPRIVNWYVCEGVKLANTCINTATESGYIDINPLLPGENDTFYSGTEFYPNGFNSTLTVLFQFDQFDFNPGNDILSIQINSTREFTDLSVEAGEDIISGLDETSIYQGNTILNKDTNYSLQYTGSANICASCQLNASIGWQLWDLNSSMLHGEEYLNETEFPKFSFYRSYQQILPTFSFDTDGTYNLKYGVFNSTGDPYSDLIESNNVNTIVITINTELDIKIDNIYPSHNPIDSNYLYGENMLTAEISNQGNKTLFNLTITMTVNNNQNQQLDESTCLIGQLAPSQSINCLFDIMTQGNNLILRVTAPNSLGELMDINPINNEIVETTNILISQISAYLIVENEKAWYTDNENITVNGFTNILAPGPINYTWLYSGLINVGYDSSLVVDTSDYGLGTHQFKLTARDFFGNSESVYVQFTILKQIDFSEPPYFTASAITNIENIEITHEANLPTIGDSYGVGGGKSPLLLYSFNLVNQQTNQSVFDGVNGIEIVLNVDQILPTNIPYETVEVRKLDSKTDNTWELFSEYNNISYDDNKITLNIYNPTTVLLIGVLEFPEVQAENFSASPAANGEMSLQWTVTGDYDSDYTVGWNVYKRIVPSFGGTVFPTTDTEYDQNIWESLTANNLVDFIDIDDSSWFDQSVTPDGFCSSYAITPVDRIGNIFYNLSSVTTDADGNANFVCGDSTPPISVVGGFSHQSIFSNDSACYDILKNWNMCYTIELQWNWLVGEENETWNLYRIEQKPESIDLHFIEPILENISPEEGSQFSFSQDGLNDSEIRPGKVFYYILAPVDKFGNERTIAFYPSPTVERVLIEDDWWAFNQHLIPEPEPEPEPPLGNEWLGDFSDNMEEDAFKVAGLVTLIVLCIGIIMLALISKRFKRLRKVISARKRRQAAESMANEFDDFFE